jgi:hypothetical protein
MKTAQVVAKQFENSGDTWLTNDGENMDEVCNKYGAWEEFASTKKTLNGIDVLISYDFVSKSEWNPREPMRYVFQDGSAIVCCEESWDIEGSSPFSWASVEELFG